MTDVRETTVGGRAITYEVRRSEDATEPRIDVDIHGVTVVIPAQDDLDPERLLEENGRWVLQKRSEFDRHREQIPERTFEPGETLPFLNESHEIHVEKRRPSTVSDGVFRLSRSHVERTSVRNALEHLYRTEARDHFTRRADHFADEMDVEYDSIELRNQRTRWGSCSTTGTLSLNWRLMMARPAAIDYVIVHELAHLRETNHSRTFWSLVAEQVPEYEREISWLEDNSARLVFSEDDV